MCQSFSLPCMGWKAFFQQQLSFDEWSNLNIGRVNALHRSKIIVLTEQGEISLPVTPDVPKLAVGDWLLLDNEMSFLRLLERASCFYRKATGSRAEIQLIAANIDIAFIVCSLNADFNLNRIERYLVLVKEAGVEPVVVLSKADLCSDPYDYTQQVQSLDPLLNVIVVNGLSECSKDILSSYFRSGTTAVFLGSSGVGKSTLANSLLSSEQLATAEIRESDSKGRHTTTCRSLHCISGGGVLIDTPGMRALQLVDCAQGVDDVFEDIQKLSLQCRFSDCSHQNEPGCAVLKAQNEGRIELRRVSHYRKLLSEQAANSEAVFERRAREKRMSKHYRSVQQSSRKQKTSSE